MWSPHRQQRQQLPLLIATILFVLLSFFSTPSLAAASPPTRNAPAAPSPTIDPDFAAMLFSAEDEEKLIVAPALSTLSKPPPARPTLVKQQRDSVSTIAKVEPMPVQLLMSDKTSVHELCRQLPSVHHSSMHSPLGLSLTSLSRLLRLLWIDSGLIDAVGEEHLMRVMTSSDSMEIVRAALQPLGSSTNNAGKEVLLREEDLPELMEISMRLLESFELENSNGIGILDEYRAKEQEMNEDTQLQQVPSPIWRYITRCLRFMHLLPSQDEYDAFWAVLVALGVAAASAGIGFAWGVKSDQKSIIGAMSTNIEQGLGSGSSSSASSSSSSMPPITPRHLRSPRHLFCANFCWVMFWVFLAVCLLFFIGYIHLFLEIQTENRALALVAKSKPIPKECRMSEKDIAASESFGHRLLDIASTFSPFTPRIRAANTDPCVKYWQEYHRSTTPNPAFVLTKFLSRAVLDPLTMLMEALGEGSYKFLGHHSMISQILLLLFALLLIIGLAWTGGLAAFCCCCFGPGRRKAADPTSPSSPSERRYPDHDREARRIELRQELKFLLEEGLDSDEERERRSKASKSKNSRVLMIEDRDRSKSNREREKEVLYLKDARKGSRDNAAASSSNSSSSSSQHRSKVRSRSPSHSRSPSRDRASSRSPSPPRRTLSSSSAQSSASKPSKSKSPGKTKSPAKPKQELTLDTKVKQEEETEEDIFVKREDGEIRVKQEEKSD